MLLNCPRISPTNKVKALVSVDGVENISMDRYPDKLKPTAAPENLIRA